MSGPIRVVKIEITTSGEAKFIWRFLNAQPVGDSFFRVANLGLWEGKGILCIRTILIGTGIAIIKWKCGNLWKPKHFRDTELLLTFLPSL